MIENAGFDPGQDRGGRICVTQVQLPQAARIVRQRGAADSAGFSGTTKVLCDHAG
jgi:hypothetical protein